MPTPFIGFLRVSIFSGAYTSFSRNDFPRIPSSYWKKVLMLACASDNLLVIGFEIGVRGGPPVPPCGCSSKQISWLEGFFVMQVNRSSWLCVRAIGTLPRVLETSTEFSTPRTPNSVISWIVRPSSRTDLPVDIPGDGCVPLPIVLLRIRPRIE